MFRSYFLNTIGDIHYFLPGVFGDNPFPNYVNKQLWTIPWELGCYISIAVLSIIGVRRRPFLALLAVIGWCIVRVGYHLVKNHDYPFVLEAVPGSLLIVGFITGISLYLYRIVSQGVV